MCLFFSFGSPVLLRSIYTICLISKTLILKKSDGILIEIFFSIVRSKYVYFGPKLSAYTIVKDRKN